MKSNNITKVFLVISSILILFLEFPVFIINTSTTDSIDNSETTSEFEIKASYSSSPIIIDDWGGGDYTWDETIGQPWCSGAGTSGNPYVVQDLVIDGGFSPGDSCLEIRNSNAYFRVENCDLFNAGPDVSGLSLYNVINGEITGCDCSGNSYFGISLIYSDNITISGNTVNNNVCGIYLYSSDLNKIIGGNTVTSNDYVGLNIADSLNNIVSGNTFNNNFGDGIQLDYSHNTIISGNSITNNDDDGLYCYYSDNVDIINGNTINLNTWDGIWSDGCYNINISGNTVNSNDYVGIDLKDNHYITAKSNIVSLNADDGFWFGECTHLDVSDNTANSNDGIGINIVDSDHGIISDNDANSNLVVGILVRDGINFTVDLNTAEYNVLANIVTMGASNCTFMSNIGRFSPAGIGLNASTDIVIKQNTLEYNEYGIVFLYSDNNRIINNDVNYNTECGIQLNFSNSNIISGNTLNLNFDTYEEIGCSGNSISGTIDTGNVQWTSAGTYKGITIKTPSLPDRPNPGNSDYLVVISPLLAQAGIIEKLLLEGQNTSQINSYLQNTYLETIEDVIAATLYMHPNAYFYIMDNDLGHNFNEIQIKKDLYGCKICYNNLNFKTLGNLYNSQYTNEIWLKYKALILEKLKNIRFSQTSYSNVLILGNSIEFPEYYKNDIFTVNTFIFPTFTSLEYFSDLSYILNREGILGDIKSYGGIGRLSIQNTQQYFRKTKDANYQKISHVAGESVDFNNPLDSYDFLQGIDTIFESKFYNPSYFQYNSFFLNSYQEADFIVSGFHGRVTSGPRGNYNNLNPCFFTGYSCLISNTINYDRIETLDGFILDEKFEVGWGEKIQENGVTLVGNTGLGIVNFASWGTRDSRTLNRDLVTEVLNGKFSTIGAALSNLAARNSYHSLVLQMRLLGDPTFNIQDFDDPSNENVDMVPAYFTTNFTLDYSVITESTGEILSINITDSDTNIKSMDNKTVLSIIGGGSLTIPTLVYNLEIPLNQTITSYSLILSNNITVSISDPAEASQFLLTPNGAVSIPILDVLGEYSYPRINIECSELTWKKVYTIQVFPALYNEPQSEFLLSRQIELQFDVSNISIASNASVSYSLTNFQPYIQSNKNYTLLIDIINSVFSIENAIMINVTIDLPSDLLINDTNGLIQGNSVDWQYSELILMKSLYIDYQSPSVINSNKYENITIFIEYLSESGTVYNSINETIEFLYLQDGFCNVKLFDITYTEELTENELISIQLRVNNTGILKLRRIPVQVFLDDTLLFYTTIDFLNSSEDILISFEKTLDTPGNFTLSIVILELSIESENSDNYFSTTITVLEGEEEGGAVKDEGDDDNGKKTKEGFDIALLVLIIIGVSLGAAVTGIIIIKKRIAGKKRIKEIRRIEEISRE